jgi:hypothetical protein
MAEGPRLSRAAAGRDEHGGVLVAARDLDRRLA